MGYENVKMWFARDENGEIITIDEVKEIHSTYNCPVCGSSLLPKAIESKKVAPHFAHIDASKCNSESHIHWWFKNKLIEPGDEFKIVSDKEKSYICKEILVEQPYTTSFGEYRPDVTVITETDEIIYFEMAFSNKKNRMDYHDKWIELNNTVVEVDVSQIMNIEILPPFKALYHSGKSFNVSKEDIYYHAIGVLKEDSIIDETKKDRIKKLDWFWKELVKYKETEEGLNNLFFMLEELDVQDMIIIKEVIDKNNCNELLKQYVSHKNNVYYSPIEKFVAEEFGEYFKKYIEFYISDNYRLYLKLIKHGKYQNTVQYFSFNKYSLSSLTDITKEIMAYNVEILNKLTIEENEQYIESLKNKIKSKFTRRISSTKIVREFKNALKHPYSVVYDVKEKDKDYQVNIHLVYSSSIVSSYGTTMSIDGEIKSLCINAINHFNKYLKETFPFKFEREIKESIRLLEEQYSIYNIDVRHEKLTEEIVEVSISVYHFDKNHYYDVFISNNGILDVKREGYYGDNMDATKILMSLDNAIDLTRYLKETIDDLILKSLTNECSGCNSKYSLTIGEYKFYHEKGFTLPKRCKDCRKKRKSNKGVLND